MLTEAIKRKLCQLGWKSLTIWQCRLKDLVKNNLQLKKSGWLVLRFWEAEIKRDLQKCIKKIKTTQNTLLE